LFYITLQNQVHLLIVLIFSSYIYLTSVTTKPEPFLKNVGTSFIIPMILSIMSFLTLNITPAQFYLFFSEFALLLALIVVLIFKNAKGINSFINILLYAFPLAVALPNLNFDSLHKHKWIDICLLACMGVILLVIIISALRKNSPPTALYAGMLLLCCSLLIPRIEILDVPAAVPLLLKAISYLIFASFIYKGSVHKLKKEYIEASGELARITDNIQREVNRRLARVEKSDISLAELTKTDTQTGVYTEKAITDFIEYQIEKDPNGEFSVLLVDINNLRKISSKLGNVAVEKCLRTLARILKQNMGKDDKVGRFGDSSFIVVLPNTNVAKAWILAEQLEKEAEATNDPHFSISTGVVSYPIDGENLKDIIKAAKKSLKSFKKSG
jgi:diguanylate cyclase (GGDEF)-like protein